MEGQIKQTAEMTKIKTWSKTISDENSSKTVRVEQVENGYIISVDTEGKEKDGNWKYSSKKYISGTNPFSEGSELPDMTGTLDEFLKDM